MLTAEERAALAEIVDRHERAELRARLLSPLFDRQRAFIAHDARRKALFCSRRAGKTTLTPRRLVLSALERQGTLQRFYAITRMRAKELVWEDLKKVCHEVGADARVNEVELSIRLPNESWIRLTGADKLKEAQKKLGDKLALAVLDEAQLYPDSVLAPLIEDILGPALEDLAGTLELYGTPGVVCTGIWWEITRDDGQPRLPGWHVDSWTVLDNTAFPVWAGQEDWRLRAIEWLAELKAGRKWADDNPTYLREWCGRWVNDTGALVYKYDVTRNGFDGTLPPLAEGVSWSHVAGSDLGVRDGFANVVWAFTSSIDEAFEVFSEKATELSMTQWEERWERIVRIYRPLVIDVDTGGYGKVIIENIKERRRTTPGKIWLPLESAEKHEKFAHQQAMNDDLLTGRLKVNRHSVLAAEMRILPKDQEDETKEDERYDNHACDAGLYGHRELVRRHFKAKKLPPDKRTAAQRAADGYKQRVVRQLQEARDKPWWDRSKR